MLPFEKYINVVLSIFKVSLCAPNHALSQFHKTVSVMFCNSCISIISKILSFETAFTMCAKLLTYTTYTILEDPMQNYIGLQILWYLNMKNVSDRLQCNAVSPVYKIWFDVFAWILIYLRVRQFCNILQLIQRSWQSNTPLSWILFSTFTISCAHLYVAYWIYFFLNLSCCMPNLWLT